MTAPLLVRDARPDDLEAVVALLREDVIREVDETEVPVSAYASAFTEILADTHQQLLVGDADGEIVATAQLSWLRRSASWSPSGCGPISGRGDTAPPSCARSSGSRANAAPPGSSSPPTRSATGRARSTNDSATRRPTSG